MIAHVRWIGSGGRTHSSSQRPEEADTQHVACQILLGELPDFYAVNRSSFASVSSTAMFSRARCQTKRRCGQRSHDAE